MSQSILLLYFPLSYHNRIHRSRHSPCHSAFAARSIFPCIKCTASWFCWGIMSFLRVSLEAMLIGLRKSCVAGVTGELALFELANIHFCGDAHRRGCRGAFSWLCVQSPRIYLLQRINGVNTWRNISQGPPLLVLLQDSQ